MEDILKAKELLKDDKTLVLVKETDIIVSTLSGIKPLIGFLEKNIDLKNYSLADKIIGKAQAMLVVKANISKVHAKVMSQSGKEILEKYGIPYSYEQLVKEIINRTGDDICPMEKTVKDIENIDKAYELLKEKISHM